MNAGDVREANLRKIGILVPGESWFASLPDRLVAVHAGAVVAIDRFWHERRGLAVDLRNLLNAVFIDHQLVGHLRQRRELHAEFVLRRADFVMMLLDFHIHLGHRRQHLTTHVLCSVLRRYREVTLLRADVVAQISAFIFGVGIGRELDRVDPEPGVVRRSRVFYVVKHEKLGFGAEEDRVAHAVGFHHAFGLFGNAARVSVVRLAGCRLEHVADQ